MRHPLIVFDFDGTLADSWVRAVAIFKRIGPGLGLKPFDDEVAARAMPTKQFFKVIGVTFWKLPRLVRAFHAAAAEEAADLKLFPEWPGVLADLAARGHTLGILSSNSEANIRTTLAANGVEGYFAFVVGYPKLFGKAKALRRIVKTRKVDRTHVLYVGDEVRDVEAAKKAKVVVAACTWGFHAEPLLRAANPEWVVSDPRALVEIASSSDGPPAQRP
jgi:phosphoglycolate phosphatase